MNCRAGFSISSHDFRSAVILKSDDLSLLQKLISLYKGPMASRNTQWRLKAGADRRFRAGHPWIYSNELGDSPKGIEPGAPVELRDASGKFLARGYGNPHSLIAFRVLSRLPSDEEPLSPEFLLQKLKAAAHYRDLLRLRESSHRLCFGEADGLSGLIIDCYKLKEGQVFVVQAHTAGMDRLLTYLPEVLERFLRDTQSKITWEQTALIIRNDVQVRKLEGLTVDSPTVIKKLGGVNFSHLQVQIAGAQGGEIPFATDLIEGQKTGFFLDQAANTRLAIQYADKLASKNPKILDLCSYVGQWSTQLAAAFRTKGSTAEVTAVDASAQALSFAAENIEAQGGRCEALKKDVLKDLAEMPERLFDIVICDPPALIKGRKDIPAGTHAYLQVNTQATRLLKKDGMLIACSCSALLEEESFLATLNKAAHRSATSMRWIARGGQAPDHPILTEFPEGRYLKAWLGIHT